jgi:excisionase family DNA binding protein
MVGMDVDGAGAPDGRLCLTVDEAADELRIGRTLARAMVRDGRLPSVRLGGRVVVPRDALAAWLRVQTTGGVAI